MIRRLNKLTAGKARHSCFAFRAIILMALFFAAPRLGVSAGEGFLFLQPGGEGSAEEARPLLNAFCERLALLGGPQMTGTYANDLASGLSLIKQKKVQAAILGPDLLDPTLLGAPFSKLLATRPLGTQKASEIYTLISKEGLQPKELTTVWTSRAFSGDFVRKMILAGLEGSLPPQLKITATPSALSTLKKIAKEKLPQAVLLDSYEFESFKRLKMESLKGLAPVHSSSNVDSSVVVVFDGFSDEAAKQRLKSALLKMSTDPKGREILQQLRLKGFDEI